MGHVYTDIIIKNTKDVIDARSGMLKDEEIRQMAVQAMVDTGAGTLVINEVIQRELGLGVMEERYVTLADKTKKRCEFTEPVEIHWKNRSTTVRAAVLTGADEVLLGAIPLEDMDLIVDPERRELTGAHGDDVVCLVM